ncbi:MAG: diguanylate cyclase [Candidatus Omnitrophica bacterium]|nr:diguanylate cyclase [Candidatus Omnitrophota bacterium]
MSEIIYHIGLPKNGRLKSIPKNLLNASFKRISKLKDIEKTGPSLVVVDESLLRKKTKFNLALLTGKVCLAHFKEASKKHFSTIKKFNCFGYFTDQDSKTEVSFKFKRALKVLTSVRQLYKARDELTKKEEQIQKMTLVDPLTGCYNWRYFLNRLSQEISRSRRYLYSVSFVGIDIDNFRQINEIYGVKVADQVTKDLVALLNRTLRKEDVLCRWRGDEFFIIAPHIESKNGYRMAARIRNKINSYKFKYRNLTISIKASIGVTSSPEDSLFNARDIVGALNRCLVLAKRKGGNTIVLHSESKFKFIRKEKDKANVVDLRGKIEKMNVLMTRDFLEMIYGFARAIEAKDSYTGKHVEYTAVLAEEIANSLKLSKSEVENIKHAAVLHDLGKVGIDGSILSKKGSLTAKERNIIKTHPSIAAGILKDIHSLRGAVPAILYHHERYDGKGYPLGLKGEEIPLSARIVSVADVYQALISDRPYRKGFSRKEAIRIVKSESGKQFDPKIVKIFEKVVKKINGRR